MLNYTKYQVEGFSLFAFSTVKCYIEHKADTRMNVLERVVKLMCGIIVNLLTFEAYLLQLQKPFLSTLFLKNTDTTVCI